MTAQIATTANAIRINGRTIHPFYFTKLANARAFVRGAHIPMVVVRGDHPHYWVVSLGDATRLEAAGYELLGA